MRPELQAREVARGRGASIGPRGSTGHPAARGTVLRLQRGGHGGRCHSGAGVQVRRAELHWRDWQQEERCEIERIPVRER